MTRTRAPRLLYLLGALLVVYLGFPVGAFLYRAATGSNEGWHDPGLWSAMRVSLEGATISLGVGVLGGVPLAYVLARRRGVIASVVTLIVQLPLAIPPLISGILLVYIVGPYTFLGQHTGEDLTQTMWGVIIAMTFVSTPFLIVASRSAFRTVDPALSEVAATLGHGRAGRFLRVEVPAASDGIRAGMILMWLRAFGEYGTVVVLAYHPYSLPVYVENLFSSAPLSQAVAPTLLAFGVAVLAILAGRVRRRPRLRRARLPAALAPVMAAPVAVDFALDTRVDSFHLQVSHTASTRRLAVVGASGSGKSVTLRGLAGLLGPQVGTVRFSGTEVGQAPPEQRRLGYVPQGYGLLPGRTVWQQVTFGVHAHAGRAAWWLDALSLNGLESRLPEQLSGGQRQRVSLARALAVDPAVLLLDEPFSALDAPVRAQLRRELRRLQHEINLSTVIVTHDPEEAAMLAEEIIVMRNGRVLQAGACRDVFQRPGSVEVGRLLGIDNLFEGIAGGRGLPVAATMSPGTPLLWHVLPEALSLQPESASAPAADSADLGPARIADVIDLGRSVEVVIDLASGHELRTRSQDLPDLAVGARCQVFAPAEALSCWPVGSAEK